MHSLTEEFLIHRKATVQLLYSYCYHIIIIIEKSSKYLETKLAILDLHQGVVVFLYPVRCQFPLPPDNDICMHISL